MVEDEAEVDGQVDVDAQDVGLESGAEAVGSLQVDEAIKQRAAVLRLRWGHPNLDALDETQHVGAHAELQRVTGAAGSRCSDRMPTSSAQRSSAP